MMDLRHLLTPILKTVAAAFGLWALAALIGSIVPANPGWGESKSGTTIWIASNPIHTAIIVPTSAEGIDLSLIFRPTDLPDSDDMGQYLAFGWGDRDFYINTPNWSDLTPRTAVSAVIGSGQSVLHVDHLRDPREIPPLRPIRLSRDQYRALIAAITDTLALGADGHPVPTPGYGSLDVFYASKREYWLFNTCNIWTGDVLAKAGVRVGLWSPLPAGVKEWFAVE
jgi:uncharacterized protein (TIGR02117 family)